MVVGAGRKGVGGPATTVQSHVSVLGCRGRSLTQSGGRPSSLKLLCSGPRLLSGPLGHGLVEGCEITSETPTPPLIRHHKEVSTGSSAVRLRPTGNTGHVPLTMSNNFLTFPGLIGTILSDLYSEVLSLPSDGQKTKRMKDVYRTTPATSPSLNRT